MDAGATINRLRAVATDYDLEADHLYCQARRGGIYASTTQSEATGKRGDAAFLRQLADGLEDGRRDDYFNEKLQEATGRIP